VYRTTGTCEKGFPEKTEMMKTKGVVVVSETFFLLRL
jgi:hypothetical protein